MMSCMYVCSVGCSSQPTNPLPLPSSSSSSSNPTQPTIRPRSMSPKENRIVWMDLQMIQTIRSAAGRLRKLGLGGYDSRKRPTFRPVCRRLRACLKITHLLPRWTGWPGQWIKESAGAFRLHIYASLFLLEKVVGHDTAQCVCVSSPQETLQGKLVSAKVEWWRNSHEVIGKKPFPLEDRRASFRTREPGSGFLSTVWWSLIPPTSIRFRPDNTELGCWLG